VHSHVKSVYRKLGASSRAEAIARAREARLI
jgi:DNA-binding CsgD family transcriptional regulator